MAHPRCSHRVLRWVFVLGCICFVALIFGAQFSLHSKKHSALGASCPSCACDCFSKTISPLYLDCSKYDADLNEEMDKDTVDLLSEELSLLRKVTEDNLELIRALTINAEKTSSNYQRETEKCNTGVDVCERARERARAALIAEHKLSELWEKRARERGWKDSRLIYH